MSVRKRTWRTPAGEERSAWVADYVDANGKRRQKSFTHKKAADAFALTASVEVRAGVHVPDSETIAVSEAGALWLKSGEASGLERTTLNQRRQHLSLHIEPFLGTTRLNKLSAPMVRQWMDTLREQGRSTAMLKRVRISLGSILADAQARGLAIRNPVREQGRRDARGENRAKRLLRVGVDVPSNEEIKALLRTASGRYRVLLVTAILTGLRASELRGLRWEDVDFERGRLHVRQRADAYGAIGKPKSLSGNRAVPMSPLLANTLREHRLAVGQGGGAALVFGNSRGRVDSHGNIINRGLVPAMLAAGVTVETDKCDENGKPVLGAKYTGLHCLRHWYASWCINPVEHGGLGLSAKAVQERLGHASITMTLDVYGHLFPRHDDAEHLAEAERRFLA